MSITHQFSTDADTLFALLTDAEILVARCQALGETNIECEVTEQGRKTLVTLQRTVKRDLPKVLAAMFSAENTICMQETWESVGSTYLGSYVADVTGQPVKLTAKFKLKPTFDGCEYTIDYQCKASIPLVGKKVEEFIISQTAGGLEQEMNWIRQRI